MPLFSKRIYLDHAAATPVISAAARAYAEAARLFGNPSAIHAEGQAARKALESARRRVAFVLGVKAHEVTFTSGGTEANNLAILGLAQGLNRADVPYRKMHMVTSAIEHPSVLECVREFERRGGSATYIGVKEDGIIDPQEVKNAIRPETILVSIQHVNSEIGVIQPVREISKMLRASGSAIADHLKEIEGYDGPYLHSDASQSPRYLDCSPWRLGADVVTIDAQKVGGHKGIGALAFARFVPLSPVSFGGSQEQGRRPGTESAALAASFAAALEDAVRKRAAERMRLEKLRDHFFAQLEERIPQAIVNGSRKKRIANNVNVSLPGRDAEYLAVWLDQHGVACSTKSACLGSEGDGSHVIRAISNDDARATSSLRFSLGPGIREADIDRALKLLEDFPINGCLTKYK